MINIIIESYLHAMCALFWLKVKEISIQCMFQKNGLNYLHVQSSQCFGDSTDSSSLDSYTEV